MPYVDPNTVHNPATGTVAPAAWGDTLRDNGEFLINPPACSVKATVGQTLTNNTDTVINAPVETFDNDSMHSTVTNNSRITIQTAGRYLFFATIRWPANITGARVLKLSINGAAGLTSGAFVVANALGTDVVMSAARSLVLTAGDFVQVIGSQSTGGNWDVLLEDFTAVFITR